MCNGLVGDIAIAILGKIPTISCDGYSGLTLHHPVHFKLRLIILNALSFVFVVGKIDLDFGLRGILPFLAFRGLTINKK